MSKNLCCKFCIDFIMILNETAVICLSQSTEYKGNKSSFYALTCALIPFHSFVIAMFYTWCSELVYFPRHRFENSRRAND